MFVHIFHIKLILILVRKQRQLIYDVLRMEYDNDCNDSSIICITTLIRSWTSSCCYCWCCSCSFSDCLTVLDVVRNLFVVILILTVYVLLRIVVRKCSSWFFLLLDTVYCHCYFCLCAFWLYLLSPLSRREVLMILLFRSCFCVWFCYRVVVTASVLNFSDNCTVSWEGEVSIVTFSSQNICNSSS